MKEKEGNIMRLLVVEDQKDLNDIIVRKLEREGYAVDTCYDGNDALDFINNTEYEDIEKLMLIAKKKIRAGEF